MLRILLWHSAPRKFSKAALYSEFHIKTISVTIQTRYILPTSNKRKQDLNLNAVAFSVHAESYVQHSVWFHHSDTNWSSCRPKTSQCRETRLSDLYKVNWTQNLTWRSFTVNVKKLWNIVWLKKLIHFLVKIHRNEKWIQKENFHCSSIHNICVKIVIFLGKLVFYKT